MARPAIPSPPPDEAPNPGLAAFTPASSSSPRAPWSCAHETGRLLDSPRAVLAGQPTCSTVFFSD